MRKPAEVMAVALLAAVAIAHLLRILLGLQVTVADRHIPMWVSGLAFIVAGGIAVGLWRGRRS